MLSSTRLAAPSCPKTQKKLEKACRQRLDKGADRTVVLNAEVIPCSVDRAAGHGGGGQLTLGHQPKHPFKCELLENRRAEQRKSLLGPQPGGTGLCCNYPSNMQRGPGLVKLLCETMTWKSGIMKSELFFHPMYIVYVILCLAVPVRNQSCQCDPSDLDEKGQNHKSRSVFHHLYTSCVYF